MPTAVDSACQMGVRFAVLTTDLTGTLFDLGFECLCPDFAYLGRTRGGGPAQ
eukprot:COSAG01_NODE_49049_length_375_cov_1.496377_1_plen_51_part_01